MIVADMERIRSALSFVPPEDRDTWRDMAFAIKDELGDSGFELWDDWSQLATNYEANAAQAVWKSAAKTGPVKIGTLFFHAKANGWRDDSEYRRPTSVEIAERNRLAAERALHEETEIAKERAETAQKALAIYKAGSEAKADNPYLSIKQVSPIATLREIDARVAANILGYQPKSRGEDLVGRLLVVPVKQGDDLSTVELIDGHKRKTALAGRGSKTGGYWASETLPKGDGDGLTILIGEGVATVLSAVGDAGHIGIASLSAGNLLPVASAIRKRFPSARLVLLADLLKANGEPDPHAVEAASATGAFLAKPDFGSEREAEQTDFNDLAQRDGVTVVAKLIEHSMKNYQLGPEEPANDKAINSFQVPNLEAADVRDGTISTRPLTEHGNACRLLDLHGETVRFVPETGGWIMWRDGAWVWDVDGANIRASAAGLHKLIYREGGSDGIKHSDALHYVKWSRASQKLNTVKNSVALFSDMERVRLALSAIDADTMLVGLDDARKVVDLRSSVVRPASTEDFITKSLNVSEVGDSAKAVRWKAFLNQVFEGDDELMDWLHRWCGYLLTGETSEQFLIFCFGLGANGKSIFAETLKYIIGDYSRAISVETLCESKRQAGGASPDLADLVGARLAMTTETEEGRALAETLVKSLVSGDSLSARPLYGSPIQFAPQFKLLMLGNHRPVIRGTDHGIWRRIMLVPFNRTFSLEERDPNLIEKLKAEAPHILAWMIEGCMAWQKRQLTDVPRIVREQTDSYRAEQDVVGQWLMECTERASASEVASSELYSSYKPWAIDNGFSPMSSSTLGRRLSERGLRKRMSHGKPLWLGISLKPCETSGPGISYGAGSRGW